MEDIENIRTYKSFFIHVHFSRTVVVLKPKQVEMITMACCRSRELSAQSCNGGLETLARQQPAFVCH
jgi:hypothetical protein